MPVIRDNVLVQRSNAFDSFGSFSEAFPPPACGGAAVGDDSVGFGGCEVVEGCNGSPCVCVVDAMVMLVALSVSVCLVRLVLVAIRSWSTLVLVIFNIDARPDSGLACLESPV